MVYKTLWLASSLDYADKTQLATTTERRSKCSRTVLFRVLLDHQVRETNTMTMTMKTKTVSSSSSSSSSSYTTALFSIEII